MKWLLALYLFSQTLFAAALEENQKLVMVYMEMEHCPWCHRMDREIMDDPESLKEIEKHYILARILKESGDIPLFLTPRFYPTTYILSADGTKIIDELPGYMGKNHFLDYIQDAYEVETQGD